MKRFVVFALIALFAVTSFAQTANPRPPRTTWNKELDYIKNGTMTLTYKTLTAPTITSPVISGTVTDAATHNNTGLWNWASDGDTIKINLYKGEYVFDLEVGNARKFAVDSTGVVVLTNGLTLSNVTDNALTIAENSENLTATFGTNSATLSSTTGLATLNFGGIGVNVGTSAETITQVDTIKTPGGVVRWLKLTVAGQVFWCPADTATVK